MTDNKHIKVAINGFGRIGRAFYRQVSEDSDINIVAINDLGDKENLRYLLEYDSVYGKFDATDFDKTHFTREKDPSNLPWADLDIDVVVEATGIFKTQELAQKHIDAGAKRVVISAPSQDAQTVLVGANEDALNTCFISSNASCTTNATSPVLAVLDQNIGIEKAVLNTVHSYTSTQHIVDGPSKDFRKGRAGALNIIPTSTGAAQATTKVFTGLQDKFDGIALRVPTPAGSIVDFTFISKRATTKEEVNDILKQASSHPLWAGILGYTDDPLVVTDIVGRREASIVDGQMTRVVDGDLVKVLAWYDNEAGYVNTLVRHVKSAANAL